MIARIIHWSIGNRFLVIENRRLKEVDSPEPHFAAMASDAS